MDIRAVPLRFEKGALLTLPKELAGGAAVSVPSPPLLSRPLALAHHTHYTVHCSIHKNFNPIP